MKERDEGLELEPETLAMIGLRGLSLGLCIYAPTIKDAAGPPAADDSVTSG